MCDSSLSVCDRVNVSHKWNLLLLGVWSSLSVSLDKRALMRDGTTEDVSCLCCSRGKFHLFSLDSCRYARTQTAGNNPPHVISGSCGAKSGGWVYGASTETGFCSIMHYHKSQGPVVYCGKLLRLWPKWFGHKEIFSLPAGPNLKNSAWPSINSLSEKREFTSRWRAPAWFSAITIWKGRRWVQ